MTQIPVHRWWVNRRSLNLKMATSLRDEFKRMLDDVIAESDPQFSLLETGELKKRKTALVEELNSKIHEMERIISSLS